MQSTAVFPGSFDPLTKGHLDIALRASRLVPKLTILLLKNAAKNPLFSIEERCEIIESILQRLQKTDGTLNINVDVFDGLTAEYCRSKNSRILIRGVRNGMDLDYEKPIAIINKKIFPELETVFLPSDPEFDFVSSSIIKEMGRYKRKELETLVPAEFVKPIWSKYQ